MLIKTCSVCGNPVKQARICSQVSKFEVIRDTTPPLPPQTLPPYVHRKLNLALTTPIFLVCRLGDLSADRNKCSRKHGELVEGLHPDAQRQPKESKS